MTDETSSASVPAIIPAPAVPASLEMTPQKLAKLAREIVVNMRELSAILKDYNLTDAQFAEYIDNNEFFKRVLEAYTIEWNSATSTEQRLKIQAQTALEESLQGLTARMNSDKEALPAAVETAKFLAKVGGIGEASRAGAAAGEKFTITINLGADQTLKFEKDIAPAIERGETVPASPLPEGDGNTTTLPTQLVIPGT